MILSNQYGARGLRMVAVPIRQDIPAEDLRRQARRESDGRVAARLLAVAAVLEGMSRGRAADLGGMDRQTLRDWVHRFNAEGIDGLRDRPRSGRPRLLAEEQYPDLARLIAQGPDLDREGVVEYRLAHIRGLALKHFGADYSHGGMHAVLQRMGFTWQTPRPIHPRSDLAIQEDFKKNSPTDSLLCALRSPSAPRSRSGSRTRRGLDRKEP